MAVQPWSSKNGENKAYHDLSLIIAVTTLFTRVRERETERLRERQARE